MSVGIRLWDVQNHKWIGRPLHHGAEVNSVAFGRDGKLLASGGKDGSVVLWDVATHQSIGQPLAIHRNEVWSLALSPEGPTLASSDNDGIVVLWDISFDSWKARACRIANRNLTEAEWEQYLGQGKPYRKTCPDTIESSRQMPPT
jgi:WD40 repeat protein